MGGLLGGDQKGHLIFFIFKYVIKARCIKNGVKNCQQLLYGFGFFVSSLGSGVRVFEITLGTWVFRFLIKTS